MNRAAKILYKKGKKLENSGKFSEAISCYESALNENPQNPDILFALGNVAKKMGAFPIAEQMFRTVYSLLPSSIEAATNLAVVISDQDRTEEAIDLYKALLANHPEHVGTWINLANTVLKLGDLENAELFYEEALRLRPGSTEALTNISELYTKKDDYSKALNYIDRALKREKGNPIIRYNRGEILLGLGRLEEGWKELDYGAQNRADRKTVYKHKLKRWNGEDLSSKKILISCEQGIGDQVRFLNCIEDVARVAQTVILETDPRLVSILSRTYPEITVKAFDVSKVTNVTQFNYDWPVNELDYASNVINLYKHLRTDITAFNKRSRLFITDEELEKFWHEQVAGIAEGLKVGICWRSGKKSLTRNIHYADIREWGPVLNTKGVTFFSLMYDECASEIAKAKERFNSDIITFDDLDYKNDLESVFALTNQMDIVISANSAPASFAGVLGIPTIMPSRDRGWDMLGTDQMAMVPNMIPIIQKEKGNWAPVMSEASDRLQKFISQKNC